jgi:hypothetical protein
MEPGKAVSNSRFVTKLSWWNPSCPISTSGKIHVSPAPAENVYYYIIIFFSRFTVWIYFEDNEDTHHCKNLKPDMSNTELTPQWQTSKFSTINTKTCHQLWFWASSTHLPTPQLISVRYILMLSYHLLLSQATGCSLRSVSHKNYIYILWWGELI